MTWSNLVETPRDDGRLTLLAGCALGLAALASVDERLRNQTARAVAAAQIRRWLYLETNHEKTGTTH